MVRIILTASLVVYAVIAVLAARWWFSGAVAPFIAALLWWRHPRARFAAYIFFTMLAARGLIRDAWPLSVFALAAVVLMQTSAARREWPRVRGDRMARP